MYINKTEAKALAYILQAYILRKNSDSPGLEYLLNKLIGKTQ